MKLRLKNFTIEHYIRYVRRQSKHMQHMHAFAFAGIVTGLIAIFILYTDYGFWHEQYRSDDIVAAQNAQIQSPGAAVASFFSEAKSRFGSIRSSSSTLFTGTETYVKDEPEKPAE
jgi:hypothetical protein